MKRKGYLYEKIINIDNLYLAERKARKGKVKKKEIIKYINSLDDNILELYNELLNKSYSISEYYHFTIYEPKERLISKLPYKDRIVHHAIMNYLEPILRKSFISQTYSCIRRKGIHKCLRDLVKEIKKIKGSIYVLKLDIKKFYPNINNEILKNLLRRKFKDNKLLELLDNIINSSNGLPLGNYTSQWFGNLYLNKFDHWLKQDKKVKYFRYCDDIVIIHNNKEFLHNLRRDIQNYLCNNLKLELSNYQIFPIDSRGIDFLGYKIFKNYILLRKTIKKKFIKMILKYPNKKSKASYYGWLIHCNSINLRNKYL